jgi:hypothetical protein
MIGRLIVAATGTVQRRSVRAPHHTTATDSAIRIGSGIGTGYGWPGS